VMNFSADAAGVEPGQVVERVLASARRSRS
jgi:hypothetical protein